MEDNINNIRNFCVLSHIDHGKSTLADRFLELTGTIPKNKMRPQFLDTMDLERERGITIKMQPVRMEWRLPENLKKILHFDFCILNLIDTPGHVDFSYEVSRSLAAVEGVVLLVDASKGIQAQTLANLELAQKQNLVIIPVVNKIDLPQARIKETVQEIVGLLKVNKEDVIKISAKFGTNVEQVLEAIIKRIPAPLKKNINNPFRALIFDSEYDSYKGVIAYIRVIDGEIKRGEQIGLLAAKTEGEAKELGYFKPEFFPQEKLSAGEAGYIATGVKEPDKVRVGDTVVKLKINDIKPLPGYQEPQSVVFASLYPENPDQFDLLKEALKKLKLNDPSLFFEPETKEALGRGFRCGFLGTLHAEIISERLYREFGPNLVISPASVVYKVDGKLIYSAVDWPQSYGLTEELWASLEIITLTRYLGNVLEILKNFQGNYLGTKYIGLEKAILFYEVPLRAIVANLYDKIKSVSQGYASMSYKILGFRKGDLVKMEILVAGEKKEALSKIVLRTQVFYQGKKLVEKLKEVLPSQQFSIALQAVVGGKIVARETIRARRKDVTGYLYGGDYTRKRKLLEKQKKGKKILKVKGKVIIPSRAYLEIFRG